MGIDGINSGAGAAFYGTQGTQDLPGAKGTKGAGQTNPNDLLDAGRRLGGERREKAELPPPPPSGKKEAADALAGLSNLGDTQVTADIFAFMALFQKLAQQMRDTARTQRTSEMQAQVSALQGAAEKMKEAAAERFNAAIVQGSMQIAGGIVQMGMSTMSAKESIKGARMEADATKNLGQIKQMDKQGLLQPSSKTALTGAALDQQAAGKALGAKGGMYQGLGQGASGLLGGMGTMISASYTQSADKLDADKMNLETQAKVHETAVQHANDTMQQMMDVIRDVRDKLQSIQQSAIETNRGIARNI